MNTIDFLIELANTLPSDIIKKTNTQPTIHNAIEMNDSEMLKLLISNKVFYANQTLVTLY